MKHVIRSVLLPILLVSTAPHVANAGQGADLDACVAQSNPAKRLACYDRLFMPAQDLERQQRQSFGAEQIPREAEQPLAPAAAIERIESRISEIIKHPRNIKGYKLENGQHWIQTSTRYVTIRSDDKVSIRRGRLGGYTMTNERGASVKVQRIN